MQVRVVDDDEGEEPLILQRVEPQSLYAVSGEASEKGSTVDLTGDSVRSILSP